MWYTCDYIFHQTIREWKGETTSLPFFTSITVFCLFADMQIAEKHSVFSNHLVMQVAEWLRQDPPMYKIGRYFGRNQMLGASRFRRGKQHRQVWGDSESVSQLSQSHASNYHTWHPPRRRRYTDPIRCSRPEELQRYLGIVVEANFLILFGDMNWTCSSYTAHVSLVFRFYFLGTNVS